MDNVGHSQYAGNIHVSNQVVTLQDMKKKKHPQ